MRELADRLQARAVRRTGELLKLFKNERARTDLDEGALTQKKAAIISECKPSANVPEAQFEAAIERPKPATVTQLAEIRKAGGCEGDDPSAGECTEAVVAWMSRGGP